MTDQAPDRYQQRYERHQARKRRTLIEVMKGRHSDRMFDNGPVEPELRAQLLEALDTCPSSCDRRAVSVRQVDGRHELELLGGLLVGGVGWVHRAPWVLLLFADPQAYKAPGEIAFMPYLDAGVTISHLLLRATDLGLAAAYVNPNLREFNRDHFHEVFGDGIFGGAVAVGYSHPDSPDRLRHEQETSSDG